MNIPLIPLFDKILIKRPPEMEETDGTHGKSIIIPGTSREKAMNGEVVSVGNDVKYVHLGDTIMFRKYAGTDVTFSDDEQYLIISEQDVLGVMK